MRPGSLLRPKSFLPPAAAAAAAAPALGASVQLKRKEHEAQKWDNAGPSVLENAGQKMASENLGPRRGGRMFRGRTT